MSQIDLNGVAKFDAHGDPSHVGQAWKRSSVLRGALAVKYE